MPLEAGFHLVLDPDDAVDTREQLLALHSLSQGRVVCEVSPDSRGLHMLTDDVLEAMGKDGDLFGAGRSGAESWRQLVVWLVAEEVRELIVSRVHLLDRGRWGSLLELCCCAGVCLWLVAQVEVLSRGQRQALSDWPIEEIDVEALLGRWQPAPETELERVPPAPFCDVPETDFTSFRARCRELLSESSFAATDRVYCGALRRTLKAVAPETGPAEVLQAVAGELDRAVSVAEAEVRLRGLQAGLFWRGWYLKVDLEQWRVSMRARLRRDYDASAAQLLRGYGDPRRAGAAALILLSRLRPGALVRHRMRDLDLGENGVISFAGTRYEVGDELVGPVRALWLQRVLDGATPDDLLLVSGRKEELLGTNPRHLRQQLRRMVAETGLPLAESWNSTGPMELESELRRDGVRLSELEGR